jgi:4-amino-4-deoxy-L-arabinose transferase-like glycosyltransferase
VGLALRVGVVLLAEPAARMIADDASYVQQTQLWLESGALDTGAFVRPPLYFAFLYAMSWITTPATWLIASKLVQCLAAAATALPVYALAARAGGRRAARIAAGFVLLDPTLIAYAAMLWPETLFTLLVALVFSEAARLLPEQTARPLALGTLTGAAMLLKPVFGLCTLLFAASWLLRFGWQRAFRLALVFATAAAIVLSPWVARNLALYGPEILLENQGPYNLWMSSHPGEPYEVFRGWHDLEDPVTRSRVAAAKGIAEIKAAPGEFLRRSAVRAMNLWGLEYFVVRNLTVGSWGEIGRARFLFWFWLIEVSYAVLLLSAATGLRGAWHEPHLRLLLIWAAVFTVVAGLLTGTTRFRVPFHVLLAVAAGVGWQRALARKLRPRDLAPLAVAALLLLFSFSRPLFATIASGSFATVEELRRSSWFYFQY